MLSALSLAVASMTVQVAQMRPGEMPLVAALRTDIFSPQLTSPFSRYQKRQLLEQSMAKKTAVLAAWATDELAAQMTSAADTEELVLGNGHVLCGSIDVLSVAVVLRKKRSKRRSSIFYITNACVHPEARRQGIGRRLVECAEAHARAAGAAALALHVEPSNTAAVELYHALGFAENADAAVATTFSTAQFVDPEQHPPEILLTRTVTQTS
jgi:ribosomal protein S18 acetylase RimI-like enzyme